MGVGGHWKDVRYWVDVGGYWVGGGGHWIADVLDDRGWVLGGCG